MKRDAGLTELVSFLLIVALVLTILAVVTAVALPHGIEKAEEDAALEALFAFNELNQDITLLCLHETPGLTRKNVIPGGEVFQTTRFYLAYGKPIGSYREAIITYEGESHVADDLSLSLKDGCLWNNDAIVLSQTLHLVVDPAKTLEQMEINAGEFVISYTYVDSFVLDGKIYALVSVRIV